MSAAVTSTTSSAISPGVYLFDGEEAQNQIVAWQIQSMNCVSNGLPYGLSLQPGLTHLQFYQVVPSIDVFPEFYYTKVVEVCKRGERDTISNTMGTFKKVAAEIVQMLEGKRDLNKSTESTKDRYERERGEFLGRVVSHFQATVWTPQGK